jgi:lysophospholipase L1-like esterase
MGDPDPSRPNGVRGWADRVGEALIASGSAEDGTDWSYANLAIRGKKVDQVIAEQIPRALELRPTLVTCYAGGNDILRPTVDVDDVVARCITALLPLKEQGADIALFTCFDPGKSKTFSATRNRYALYNEFIREAAETHGFALIDYWRMRELQDWRYWDEDRLHMSAPGHQFVASRVLAAFTESDDVDLPTLPEAAPLTRREQLRSDVVWARKHFVPWVGRRVRGVSSGDGMSPKYPQFVTNLTKNEELPQP